jgi:hypothetical protein
MEPDAPVPNKSMAIGCKRAHGPQKWTLVSRQTNFFVQTLDAVTGDQLKAGAPIACRTAEGALRTAERLALSKTGALSKGGVVAFSTTSDADNGRL